MIDFSLLSDSNCKTNKSKLSLDIYLYLCKIQDVYIKCTPATAPSALWQFRNKADYSQIWWVWVKGQTAGWIAAVENVLPLLSSFSWPGLLPVWVEPWLAISPVANLLWSKKQAGLIFLNSLYCMKKICNYGLFVSIRMLLYSLVFLWFVVIVKLQFLLLFIHLLVCLLTLLLCSKVK